MELPQLQDLDIPILNFYSTAKKKKIKRQEQFILNDVLPYQKSFDNDHYHFFKKDLTGQSWIFSSYVFCFAWQVLLKLASMLL